MGPACFLGSGGALYELYANRPRPVPVARRGLKRFRIVREWVESLNFETIAT